MSAARALWAAIADRIGWDEVFLPIIKHPVPRTSREAGWLYVFGSATLVSFIVAVISGIPLAAQYATGTGQAYQSLEFISHQAILGLQIRSIHYFSASAMMILIGIHMLRVFVMGAYKYPREVNWILGVLLLILTVGIVFTGQILRWDQIGVNTLMITVFQAVRTPFIGNWVGDLVLGGNTITGVTLSRMYALHVFVLPGLLFAVVGFHIYMVVHAGISDVPARGRPVEPGQYRAWYRELLKRDGVPFWPDAAWRDVAFGVAVVIVITAVALIFGPPALAGPPNPADVNVIPRPDWYFLWYYAALALLPYGMENYVIILGPLLLFVGLFSLPFWANRGERSPTRRPWAAITAILAAVVILTLTVIGSIAPWSPQFSAKPLPPKVVASTSPSVAAGAALFFGKGCEYCHTIGGYGGTRGPDLTNVGDQLTGPQITLQIMNGGENMPAYASTLTTAQVNDLVAFLQSRTFWNKYGLGGQAAAPPPPPTTGQRFLSWNTSTHTATLMLVAGATSAIAGFNFNGYGNGQMVISVPVGYKVNVLFSNHGTFPHSAMITPYTDKSLTTNYPLAFPGASSTNPVSGTPSGGSQQFSFAASKAGMYALICAVPGHVAAGMWDVFKVTSGGVPSLVT
jgi:ubiquinol-cytochrome c reductase cytochrome b subunit